MNCRLAATSVILIAFCGAGPVVGAQARVASPKSVSHKPVTLTYLGAAGWEITDGTTVILLDPYFSRIPLLTDRSSLGRAESADRRPIDPNTVLVSDTAAVDAHVRRADFILLHHAHFDHILDAPYIARKTGATAASRF